MKRRPTSADEKNLEEQGDEEESENYRHNLANRVGLKSSKQLATMKPSPETNDAGSVRALASETNVEENPPRRRGSSSKKSTKRGKRQNSEESTSAEPKAIQPAPSSPSAENKTAAMKPQQPANATIRMLNDIFCGKGIPIQTYPGNRRLHEIVASFREQYEETPRQKKADIIKGIVLKMKSEGSRFLRRADSGVAGREYWEEVDDEIAYQKVAHVFRNQKQRREGKQRPRQRKQEEDIGSSLSSQGVPARIPGNKTRRKAKTSGSRSARKESSMPVQSEQTVSQGEAKMPSQGHLKLTTPPSMPDTANSASDMLPSGLAAMGMSLSGNPMMSSSAFGSGRHPFQHYQPRPSQLQGQQIDPMISALSALISSSNHSSSLPPSVISVPASSEHATAQSLSRPGNSSVTPGNGDNSNLAAPSSVPHDSNPHASAVASLLSSLQAPPNLQSDSASGNNPLIALLNNSASLAAMQQQHQRQQGDHAAQISNLIFALLQQQQQLSHQAYFPQQQHQQQQQHPMQNQLNMGANNNAQLLMMALQLIRGGNGGSGFSGINNGPGGGGL